MHTKRSATGALRTDDCHELLTPAVSVFPIGLCPTRIELGKFGMVGIVWAGRKVQVGHMEMQLGHGALNA